MSTKNTHFRLRVVAAVAIACGTPSLAAAATRSVDQKLAADPQGSVAIYNVAGRIDVVGWDRPEIAVTGTLGDGVERLDFTSSGGRAEVRVVLPKSSGSNRNGDANLTVRVPARSAVLANVVSADLTSKGVVGRQELKAVSGNVDAEGTRDLRVSSVSGDVKVATSAEPGHYEIQSVSGDVVVRGGAGGEVDAKSVSGDVRLELGTLERGRFKSVSGDLTVDTGLAASGRLDVETVSGDVRLGFAARPPAEFDVETNSGSISNCFGPKPVEPKYGPGSRLQFREGAGTAQVRVDTQSGDVNVCAR